MATISLKETLKVEIRPIPNRDGIKTFSENLEYFSQAHIIAPFVNPVSLCYDTGLSEEDLNYLKEKQFPYDVSNNYKSGKSHPFWDSNIIKTELKNSPMFLYPGKSLLDFVKWKYLLVNNYIYKSETEMLSGSKPQATHYIYNEIEELEIKATALEKRDTLIKEVGKTSLDRKRKFILLIEDEITENKDDNYITVKMNNIIEDKDKSKSLKTLLDLSVEDLSLKAEVRTAIRKQVLKRTKKGIFYFETNLGFTEKDVMEFLEKEENQEILLSIQTKMK